MVFNTTSDFLCFIYSFFYSSLVIYITFFGNALDLFTLSRLIIIVIKIYNNVLTVKHNLYKK